MNEILYWGTAHIYNIIAKAVLGSVNKEANPLTYRNKFNFMFMGII
jgi:hypothetical protein